MKLRTMRFTALMLSAVLVLGLAACSSDDEPADDGEGSDGPAPSQQTEGATQYIGLSLDDAGELAESEGRPWRVGVEDGESLPLTADLVPGRITFELEDNVVTDAQIEEELDSDNPGPETDFDPEDPDAAAIIAASVNQVLTVDHTFGVGEPPPFDDVRVANVVGGAGGPALTDLTLEAIAEVVQATGATVEFTSDPRAMIEELFDQNQIGVAVVTVGDVRIEDGRAEVDMEMWCGSLCGIYLTYEVVEDGGSWTVAGTLGPIAIS